MRSFLGEDWVVTARCYLGVVIVLLGVVLAVVGAVVVEVPMLLSGVGTAVFGVFFVLVGCRLSTRQQQYLSRAERELLEIREYRAFLEDVAAERAGAEGESGSPPPAAGTEPIAGDTPSGEGTVGPPSGSGPPPLWELRSRLELAEEILEEAREAVYRRDYASFLSMYYEASRQEILLYDILDEYAGGWWFGLDSDRTGGSDREVAVSPVGVPHRRWNLSQRIRSFAEGSLPERRLDLVREYLGGPEDLPTPWQLYYAIRVLHEWNVGRYERALDVKRFLRGGILALVVVLVGLGVVLPLAFPEGFLEPFGGASAAGNGTITPGPGVVTNDGFLGLMVLAGALGAVFSLILRSFGDFYTLTTDPTVPEPVFMLEALVARTLFGGVSALILFFVARTDLAAVVFTQTLLTSPLSLLLLGFVAGLSEQLVKQSLNEVIENIGAEESADGDAGAGRTAGATTAHSTAAGEHLPVEVLRELTEEERSRSDDADEDAADAAADTSTADEPNEEDSEDEDPAGEGPDEDGERDGER